MFYTKRSTALFLFCLSVVDLFAPIEETVVYTNLLVGPNGRLRKAGVKSLKNLWDGTFLHNFEKYSEYILQHSFEEAADGASDKFQAWFIEAVAEFEKTLREMFSFRGTFSKNLKSIISVFSGIVGIKIIDVKTSLLEIRNSSQENTDVLQWHLQKLLAFIKPAKKDTTVIKPAEEDTTVGNFFFNNILILCSFISPIPSKYLDDSGNTWEFSEQAISRDSLSNTVQNTEEQMTSQILPPYPSCPPHYTECPVRTMEPGLPLRYVDPRATRGLNFVPAWLLRPYKTQHF